MCSLLNAVFAVQFSSNHSEKEKQAMPECPLNGMKSQVGRPRAQQQNDPVVRASVCRQQPHSNLKKIN